MRISRNKLLIIGLVVFVQSYSCAKTIPIPVEKVFETTTQIRDIEVVGYIGDSILTYIDLGSRDTLELDCKWKKYSESSIKILKKNNSNYSSWEGTFPKVGETITMVNYEYGGSRILFARRVNGSYRFWDPRSIPFANSVFFVAKGGIYKPTQSCKNDYQTENEFHCSDGFLISQKDFEKMKTN